MKLRPRPIALALAAVLACASCSQYEPFDSADHLRRKMAERLGLRAEEVTIPFELDDEIRTIVDSRVNPAGDDQSRVDAIRDFIFGPLDLQYSLTPTRTAVETFEARQGNCLSFVNLFVGISRYMRMAPFYVEVEDYQRWNYHEGTVVSRGHIVAGVYVDGNLSTFDFLPYQPKSYRKFQPLDDLTALAHYYNNLGAEALIEGDVDRAEELLDLAVALAPDFAKAANNYGVMLLRRGESAQAETVLARALGTEPENVALLTNLARALQRQGRSGEAEALLAKMEGVRNTNPFYFIARGEMALARGEPDEALELMRKAFRLESESPEVHVGLVKAYVALGELERARHHVERALKLDATNSEAREYAVLLHGQKTDPRTEEPR